MSYENAPATKLLATNCCACGRALVDAASVEAGMGPDCREKYGYNIEAEPANRLAANAIVHKIACGDKSTLVEDCATLAKLGYSVLSAKLIGRVAKVVVSESNGMFAVKTPYNEALVSAMRNIAGRRWVKEEKLNYFPVAQKASLFDLLKKFFAGEVAVGPKGVFVIPALVEQKMVSAQAMYDAELARLQSESA